MIAVKETLENTNIDIVTPQEARQRLRDAYPIDEKKVFFAWVPWYSERCTRYPRRSVKQTGKGL